jgi:hypothetical protein
MYISCGAKCSNLHKLCTVPGSGSGSCIAVSLYRFLVVASKGVRENLKVMIDTGSQGNVPNECSVKCIQEKSTLPGVPQRNAVKNRHVVLTAYNGTKIPQYGAIQLQCRYDGCKWINIDFYVVDSEGPAILGLPSSLDHKLVTLDCEMRESNEESRPTESRHGMSKPKDNSRRVNKTCHHLPS